jgi:hypothetical protein
LGFAAPYVRFLGWWSRVALSVPVPHLAGLVIEQVESVDGVAVVTGRPRSEGTLCPACGRWSTRVRDRYQRLLVDGGVDGRGLRVRLTVRRFRCLDGLCPTGTFSEQVEGLIRPYARFTEAVEPMLAAMGMSLAGRAGARHWHRVWRQR